MPGTCASSALREGGGRSERPGEVHVASEDSGAALAGRPLVHMVGGYPSLDRARLRFGFPRRLCSFSPSMSADGATLATDRRGLTSASRLRRDWRRSRLGSDPRRRLIDRPRSKGARVVPSRHGVTRAAGRSARPGPTLLSRQARRTLEPDGDGARRNRPCWLMAPVDRPRGENRSTPCHIEQSRVPAGAGRASDLSSDRRPSTSGVT